MAIAGSFAHVQVHEHLTDLDESPEVERQLIGTVTSKGFEYTSLPTLDRPADVRLTPHGWLQVCLRRIDPFRQCAATEIQDLRVIPIQAVRCRDRPLLIEALADALIGYEDQLQSLEVQARGLAEHLQEAFSTLRDAADIYLFLRARRALSQRVANPALRKPAIEQAHQVYDAIVRTLTPEDYIRIAGVSQTHSRTKLCGRMRDAFHRYGPLPQEFPDASVYHAIALILWHLKVEPGTKIDAIVKRLRRRAERSPGMGPCE